MMVAWSKHTGAKDRSGDGAIRYFKDAYSMKRGADGKLVREQRNPPPEILRGHPDLARRAINSLNTKHVYASGVLSFHTDDVDVEAFNRGDPALCQTVDRLMDEFEDVMFKGVPKDMRPPLLWATHTHTGRLELNVLAPRFVYSGKPDPGTDMLTALVWLSDKSQSEKQLRTLEQKRRSARKAETEAIRKRLDDLLRERKAFNRQRYGRPAWAWQQPDACPDHGAGSQGQGLDHQRDRRTGGVPTRNCAREHSAWDWWCSAKAPRQRRSSQTGGKDSAAGSAKARERA